MIVVEPGVVATELAGHISDERIRTGVHRVPGSVGALQAARRRRNDRLRPQPAAPRLAQRDPHQADRPGPVAPVTSQSGASRMNLPATGTEVHLVARPQGEPRQSDFAVVEVALPEPAAGHVLVHNRFLWVTPT